MIMNSDETDISTILLTDKPYSKIFYMISFEDRDLILFPIQPHSWCMCQQDMVSCYVWLRCWIASAAVILPKWRWTALRWCNSCIITSLYNHIWLVNCTPILDPISKLSEAHIRIFSKVFPAFTNKHACSSIVLIIINGLLEVYTIID